MNMMSVLLGATGLLLVAALILSVGSMNSGTDPKELAALRAEAERLNSAERELALYRQNGLPTTPVAPSTPIIPANPATPSVEEANRAAEDAARIAALEAELADVADDAEEVAKKAEIYREEAGLIAQRDLEKTDKEGRRARIIQEALLIATVTQYSADDGFAVVNVQRHDNAQEGAKLAIRRKAGIIGHVQISSLYPDSQAVADPLPGTFIGGNIDIQAGDELIIPPL